jgi:hypothetical protein
VAPDRPVGVRSSLTIRFGKRWVFISRPFEHRRILQHCLFVFPSSKAGIRAKTGTGWGARREMGRTAIRYSIARWVVVCFDNRTWNRVLLFARLMLANQAPGQIDINRCAAPVLHIVESGEEHNHLISAPQNSLSIGMFAAGRLCFRSRILFVDRRWTFSNRYIWFKTWFILFYSHGAHV